MLDYLDRNFNFKDLVLTVIFLFMLSDICVLAAYSSIEELDRTQSYSDKKRAIIYDYEQKYLGNYSQIKDCIDFELNYKLEEK